MPNRAGAAIGRQQKGNWEKLGQYKARRVAAEYPDNRQSVRTIG